MIDGYTPVSWRDPRNLKLLIGGWVFAVMSRRFRA
jgi:hypothetical protein